MARHCIASALLSAAALVSSVGCQSNQQTTTGPLPGPNFAGPLVTQAPQLPLVQTYKPPVQKAQVTRRDTVPTAWIPTAGAEKRQWNWIVIHHSGGDVGGAKAFDKYHREVKGWDELGYHFVIGNGSDTADGLIEVGPRWPVQKHGAHAKTPDNKYNEHGIGICLVGNFDNHRPSAKQLASLTKLIAYLADTYKVPQASIIGHKMTGKLTDCPGKFMDVAAVRASVAQQRTIAIANPANEAGDPTVELMQNATASASANDSSAP